MPGSRPLDFQSSPDVATELATWPRNHVVKWLAFYHPDDPDDLRERQERQLLRLHDAARKTGHELLVEIIAANAVPVDDHTVARAIQRLYDLGMRPDWWKLEPSDSADAWRNIERTIVANDTHCRGVVLLGLSAPEADLVASIQVAPAQPLVKGFVVGSTMLPAAAARRVGAGK